MIVVILLLILFFSILCNKLLLFKKCLYIIIIYKEPSTDVCRRVTISMCRWHCVSTIGNKCVRAGSNVKHSSNLLTFLKTRGKHRSISI